MNTIKMKTIKTIKIDIDKCTGCGLCETICSAFHSQPKYSNNNPKRSRIRVFRDEANNVFIPILAGQYTETECNSRYVIVINNKMYSECSFCRASCPSRDLFKEPGTNIALKCDVCGEPMPPGGPLCVQWCINEALTYEPERVEEIEVGEEAEEEIVEEL